MLSLDVYIFTSLVVLKSSLGVEYDCLYAARIMDMRFAIYKFSQLSMLIRLI
jgi:hypothetical protein